MILLTETRLFKDKILDIFDLFRSPVLVIANIG